MIKHTISEAHHSMRDPVKSLEGVTTTRNILQKHTHANIIKQTYKQTEVTETEQETP